MSADTYFSGNRSLSGAAYQWAHELRKLPASSETWEWGSVVGKSKSKVAYRAVYRFLQAGEIIETEEGYRTSEELESYLAEHGVELDSWRSCLTEDDAAVVIDGHGRVARWVEERCECVECSESFDTALSARMHWTACHASQGGSDSSVSRGSQATLDEFSRVSDSMQTGVDGQARLVV